MNENITPKVIFNFSCMEQWPTANREIITWDATQFGTAQAVPAAALSGVFKVLNLEQARNRGLALFWSHGLDKLGAFIESTR